MSRDKLLARRRAGVLLHFTSLPGPLEFGDLGPAAYRFIEFLAASGISVWQTLPLGPTNLNLSPYQCLSVHAGNPQLISLEWIKQKGWLKSDYPRHMAGESWNYRLRSIRDAYDNFKMLASEDEKGQLEEFINKNTYWLQDYAMYLTLRGQYQMQSWIDWPEPYRTRDPSALQAFSVKNKELLGAINFQQFVFFEQWRQLKAYANERGILMLGDMPIFVAHDSADVWAHSTLFALDEKGQSQFVAGTPPDFFSETGQRWGNPLYRWDEMEKDNFAWWVNRLRTLISQFDGIRIDHFRGLAAYWEIPGADATAENGRWVEARGDKLLQTLIQSFPDVCLIAEDLGTITPDVIEMRDRFNLPGMNVLQFAFDGSSDNPYLPENHQEHSVVYTGTHDNDTTLSWFESQSAECQRYILGHLIGIEEPMPWPMIITALNSVSRLAVVPMQDFLGLGSGHRMNIPGTVVGNWRWRFSWNQLDPNLSGTLSELHSVYKRAD